VNQEGTVRHAWILAAALLLGGCQFAIDGVETVSKGPADSAAPPRDLGGVHGSTTPPDMGSITPTATPDMSSPPADMTMFESKVGDTCSGTCGTGLTCMTWVANGYCSQTCNSGGCPNGSSCVDIGDGNGNRYCLANANNKNACPRSDLSCRDCGASVCGPAGFCSSCG
jgi:hypothetical protein